MMYRMLQKVPREFNLYAVVDAACQSLFEEIVIAEFARGTALIRTASVPIEWVVSVSRHPSAASYEISMLTTWKTADRVHGLFFFENSYRRDPAVFAGPEANAEIRVGQNSSS